jgi:transposase
VGDETDFETCIETSASSRAERLDVIETAGGKRRWTPEARARIIAESLEPGANVSAVARRHGMFPQQLYTWRRGLRERAEAMSFVPAMVERENTGALLGPPPQSVGGQIVIETGNLKICVPDDVSADHIERVLLAVQVSA